MFSNVETFDKPLKKRRKKRENKKYRILDAAKCVCMFVKMQYSFNRTNLDY